MTTFGTLLRHYRLSNRAMTARDLEETMRKIGYPISSGLISKYERGRRSPTPELIYYLAQALKLEQDEVDALIHTHLFDLTTAFLDAYQDITKRENYQANIPKEQSPEQDNSK